MHLKSLTLKGFKSFAQSTTFAFEPGVTCIVGPNGSGKSNVVDALAWVMGEQGAKSLRGGTMSDVIFAGTATRGPLGRAEVVLTIDNGDGALPIEYAEVAISRTLFRSGASEYAINGETCRLLDVQELLSDSGLGREMHVIVGQGQLDAVLRATPEERRGFIEEAAGILKHRRRKERTLRKLESMQANLARLNDLAEELRRQLKPLGAQAEVAREAVTIQATVRDARTRLLAADVARLAGSVAALETARAELELEQQVAVDRERRLERAADDLERAEATAELDDARRAALELESVQERVRALARLATTRVALLGPDEVPAAVSGIEDGRREAVQVELARLEPALTDAGAAARAALAEQAAAQSALDAVDERVAAEATAVADYDRRLAALASTLSGAETRLAALQAEAHRRAAAAEAGESRRSEAAAALSDLPEPPPPGGADDQLSAAEGRVVELSAELEALRADLHRAEREQSGLESRIAALDLATAVPGGIEALLASGVDGLAGRVTESLSVEGGWSAAIAAVLGPLADAALARDPHSALAALDAAQDLGGVDVVVAEPDRRPAPVQAVPGTVAAGSVVRGPAGLTALLAPVLLVEDIAAARAVLPGLADPSAVLVTRDGAVLAAASVRSPGGSRSGLELVEERQAAADRLATVVAEVADLRHRAAESTGSLAEVRSRVRFLADGVRQQQAAAREAERRSAAVTARSDAATAEAQRLTAQAADALAAVAPAETATAQAAAALEEARQQPRPVLDAEQRVAALAAVEAARERSLAARLETQRLRDRLVAERRRLEDLERAETAARREAAAAEQRNAERRTQRATAEAVLEEIPALQASVDRSVTDARVRLAELERHRAERSGELVSARRELGVARSRTAELDGHARDLDMRLYEQRVSLGALLEKAAGELGLDETALLAEAVPDLDRQAEERRLRSAERRLAQLGRVNPLALEEFAALEQRHTFLVDQLADLNRTRADLLTIVDE
ncbi:MAG: chromosome segregation protein, partial [Microbacteriaceae bacterium]|nr:chromosome segregation protein [Microbacteriaceae bacterium]